MPYAYQSERGPTVTFGGAPTQVMNRRGGRRPDATRQLRGRLGSRSREVETSRFAREMLVDSAPKRVIVREPKGAAPTLPSP